MRSESCYASRTLWSDPLGGQMRTRSKLASGLVIATVCGLIPATPAFGLNRSIIATPNVGLRSGDAVHIDGAGFAANTVHGAVQCLAATINPFDCDLNNVVAVLSDGGGHLAVDLTVQRTMLTSAGLTDCSTQPCEVLVGEGTDFSANAVAPIAFAPGSPTATLSASPSTLLADRQLVNVTGTGWSPDSVIGVGECLVGTSAGVCTNIAPVFVGSDGSMTTTYTVRRIVRDGSGTNVDCASTSTTCELVALDIQQPDNHASAAIAFDPSLPPPPPPTLRVVPSKSLAFYARLDVTGRGWSPGDYVDVYQCGVSETDLCLPIGPLGFVTDGGRIHSSILATRMLRDPFGESAPIDCASRPGRCAIYAEDPIEGIVTRVPITFDPKAPVPPAPKVTISPRGPYRGNQKVKVVGENFPPTAQFFVGQCGEREGLFGCKVGFNEHPVDSKGRFEVQFELARKLGFGEGDGVDCARSRESCVLEVQSEGNIVVDRELRFVKTGPAAMARVLRGAGIAWQRSADMARRPFATSSASLWRHSHQLRSRGWSTSARFLQ